MSIIYIYIYWQGNIKELDVIYKYNKYYLKWIYLILAQLYRLVHLYIKKRVLVDKRTKAKICILIIPGSSLSKIWDGPQLECLSLSTI